MTVATTIEQVRETVRAWRKQGLTVGLVPTMGYLHEGHASLISASVRQCDKTVVSIFVNPTQFAPNEDLEAYPRDFAHDVALCANVGADLVFHPSVNEMYPDGNGTTDTFVEILNDMPKQLCGQTRPIHFRGVCTVVSKLFNIVLPDCAFFGEKDAQQLAIIRRMVRDLSYGIEIVGCPIIREVDGLAKSSRNTYLNADERQAALCLSKGVKLAQTMVAEGEADASTVLNAMKSLITAEPLARIDYVQAVDGLTMQSVDTLTDGVLVAMAVYIGKTRLIDNFTVRK